MRGWAKAPSDNAASEVCTPTTVYTTTSAYTYQYTCAYLLEHALSARCGSSLRVNGSSAPFAKDAWAAGAVRRTSATNAEWSEPMTHAPPPTGRPANPKNSALIESSTQSPPNQTCSAQPPPANDVDVVRVLVTTSSAPGTNSRGGACSSLLAMLGPPAAGSG